MNIILLGPPGSGKGTQAKFLEDKFHYKTISTGNLIRAEIDQGTSLGNQVKEIVDEGRFPQDEIIMNLLENCLNKTNPETDLILDGVPRTLQQAKSVDVLLKKFGRKVDLVLEFSIDESALVERLSARFMCKQCNMSYNTITKPTQIEGVCDICGGQEFFKRADDSLDAIKTRLNVYNAQTKPLIDYYIQQGQLKRIDASEEAEKLNDTLITHIKPF